MNGTLKKIAILAGSAFGLTILPTASAVYAPISHGIAPASAGAVGSAAAGITAPALAAAPSAVMGGTAVLSLRPPVHSGPEAILLGAIETFRRGDVDTALTEVRGLVELQPTFRLAHLVYGDLLVARTGAPVSLGTPGGAGDSTMEGLLAEARQRWRHSGFVHDDRVPANLLRLSPQQRHGIVVDLARSRMFLYENRAGDPVLIGDYYVSGGKNGAGKQVKGDKKTPIGVYFVTSRLSGESLPDKYGPMAFPVDYPNAWDLRLGRTGDGIWLHGVASDTYSRPPLDSDGCVAMPNEELSAIAHLLKPGQTPIVIGENLTWLSPEDASARRADLERTLENWRMDWESGDNERYIAHYSEDFLGRGLDKAGWAEYKRGVNARKQFIRIALSELSLYEYPSDDLVLVDFRQGYESDSFKSEARKRQFWKHESDGHWRVVAEVTL